MGSPLEALMDWRLGLDLGTNSIGWTVIKLKDKKPAELTDMGSRIFSDGREPAGEGRIGEPLAAARRLARGIRKNIYRRKLRKRALVRQLIADGLFPQDKEKRLALKNLDPYALRTQGLDKKLKPAELGRALFHLGVRRGFKSNRKDTGGNDQAQKELEGNAAKTELLYKTMEEAKARTLGEFLFMTHQERDKKSEDIFASAKYAKRAVR
ncbi:MAG: hypothetical protein LBB77_06440, partial [Treponema sp.]|nr:hypothetical protein [Treponema sp.]